MSDALRATLAARFPFLDELTLIGTGKCSATFSAREKERGQTVALKVLRPDSPEREVARFDFESELGATLRHPGLITVHSSGESEGFRYQIQELTSGDLSGKGRPTWQQACQALAGVAEALAYLHEKGAIHRNLRPGNLRVVGGAVKIAGLGGARLPADESGNQRGLPSTATGHPAYAAPELFLAPDSADRSVDIYALGVSAFELITGELPYHSSEPEGWLEAQQADFPEIHKRAEGVPRILSELLERMCANKVKLRERDGRRIGKLLRGIADGSLEEIPDIEEESVGLGVSADALKKVRGQSGEAERVLARASTRANRVVAPTSPVEARVERGNKVKVLVSSLMIVGAIGYAGFVGLKDDRLVTAARTLRSTVLHGDDMEPTKDTIPAGAGLEVVYRKAIKGSIWVFVRWGDRLGMVKADDVALPGGRKILTAGAAVAPGK